MYSVHRVLLCSLVSYPNFPYVFRRAKPLQFGGSRKRVPAVNYLLSTPVKLTWEYILQPRQRSGTS